MATSNLWVAFSLYASTKGPYWYTLYALVHTMRTCILLFMHVSNFCLCSYFREGSVPTCHQCTAVWAERPHHFKVTLKQMKSVFYWYNPFTDERSQHWTNPPHPRIPRAQQLPPPWSYLLLKIYYPSIIYVLSFRKPLTPIIPPRSTYHATGTEGTKNKVREEKVPIYPRSHDSS